MSESEIISFQHLGRGIVEFVRQDGSRYQENTTRRPKEFPKRPKKGNRQ